MRGGRFWARALLALVVVGSGQAAVAPVIAGASPAPTAAPPEAVSAAITGNEKFVTVLCRFSDSTGTTPKDLAYMQGLFGDAYPGVGHYWNETSYNQLNTTGSVVKGWYNLPEPLASYGTWDAPQLIKAASDCTKLADAEVDYNQYYGVNLVFNQVWTNARGGFFRVTLDGTDTWWPMTFLGCCFYDHQSVVAHEMGHAFGLYHSSGPYGVDGDSQFDVMGAGGRVIGTAHPTYGRLGTDTIAYHKDKLGWIPAARKYTAADNSCAEVNIDHLAQVPATTGNYLMAEIPISVSASASRLYTVEARKALGYDGGGRLPGEAVLIHEVDTTRYNQAQLRDNTVDNDPNDEGAMWLPGETFTDAANGVKVEVLAATTNGWTVRVTKGSGVCLAAPTLVSPSTSGVTNPVTYRWNATTGATSYRLYVTGPGGVRQQTFTATESGCPAGTGTCQVTPTGNAEGGVPWQLGSGTYTWWAQAVASAGSGPWSSNKTFTVGPPAAPVLVSPSSNAAAPNPVAYRWNASPGATWYQLYVSGPGGVRQQWFTAGATGCSSGTGACQITPTGNADAGVPWQLQSGVYTWWVRGWNAAGNGAWSTNQTFTGVFGFDSQFPGNTTNWTSRSGTWTSVNNSHLSAAGVANSWASAYYANAQFQNFTYEARLWRDGGSSLWSGLVVRGQPASTRPDGAWYSHYVFLYDRNGRFSVWKTVNGAWIQVVGTTTSSAIVKGSTWNTLRATVNGTNLSFAINGTTVWTGSDTSFSAGYAGVTFYSDGSAGNRLYVDYAKLTA